MTGTTKGNAPCPQLWGPSHRHRAEFGAGFELKGNKKKDLGNRSVDNVLLLSIRKASVAGERWSTGESAQPTVHRLVLWTAQLSTAGASNHHTAPPRL